RQLAAAVDVEVRVRISHAVDVAHLPGQIEDDFTVPHQMVHGAFLPHVRDVDPHAIGEAVDVEEVPAEVRDQRIHQQHVSAKLGQPARDVAADEAQTAGDHDPPPAVEIAVGIGAHDGSGC